jgi:hypothetical protein
MQYEDSNGKRTAGVQTCPASHWPGEGSLTLQSRALAPHPASGTLVVEDIWHVPGMGAGALTTMWAAPHPGPKSTQVPDDMPTLAHCEPVAHIPPW